MVQAQTQHGGLPEASSDEAARQEFVVAYRRHVQTQLRPGNRKIYDNRVEPEFVRGHNRPPRTGTKSAASWRPTRSTKCMARSSSPVRS